MSVSLFQDFSGQNLTMNGLGTLSFEAPQDGAYLLDGKISLPSLARGSDDTSELVVTIDINNGSPIYTGDAGAEGFLVNTGDISGGDIINMNFSSSADVDQPLNVLKASIAISRI